MPHILIVIRVDKYAACIDGQARLTEDFFYVVHVALIRPETDFVVVRQQFRFELAQLVFFVILPAASAAPAACVLFLYVDDVRNVRAYRHAAVFGLQKVLRVLDDLFVQRYPRRPYFNVR